MHYLNKYARNILEKNSHSRNDAQKARFAHMGNKHGALAFTLNKNQFKTNQ